MTEEFIPDISHIVCIDKMGLIGESNNLIWNIPEELTYFKNTTKDSIVLMGGNTFISLNSKPLSNRINIVISKKLSYLDSDILYIRNSLEEGMELSQYLALKDQKNIFIIGGESIYNQTFDFINKIYISVIDYNYYHSPTLKDKVDILYYYNYDNIDTRFALESETKIMSTNYFYPVSTYVLTVIKDVDILME